METKVPAVDARLHPSFDVHAQRLRYEGPRRTAREHATDFGADAQRECADAACIGAVPVVVEIEHARKKQAALGREDVTVPAAAGVVELRDTPVARRLAVERTARGCA